MKGNEEKKIKHILERLKELKDNKLYPTSERKIDIERYIKELKALALLARTYNYSSANEQIKQLDQQGPSSSTP